VARALRQAAPEHEPWTSKLPHSRYRRATPLFPTREQAVQYLEEHVAQHELDARPQISVEPIDPDGDG